MITCPLALYMKPWQIARFTILAVGFDDQGKDIWAPTMLRYSRRRGLAYCSANHCVDDDNAENAGRCKTFARRSLDFACWQLTIFEKKKAD